MPDELELDGVRAAYRGLKCRTCAQPILLVTTPNGRRLPLDVHPTDDGTVELRRALGQLVAVTHSGRPEEGRSRYRVHVASCKPRVRGWRGRA